MDRLSRKFAVGAVIVALGIPGAGLSAQAADLEPIVAEQARRIEQLEAEQRRMQAHFDAQRAAPETERATPGSVDPEYVDRRIEDFEQASVSRFLVSGYGSASLVDVKRGTTAFGASFNPGFHFRMAESLHFVAELEIELEVEAGELETEFGLEFAQVDYLATDWLVLSGGKFLTPFNTWV